MNAPKEFIDLVYSDENHQSTQGMGNPNARHREISSVDSFPEFNLHQFISVSDRV